MVFCYKYDVKKYNYLEYNLKGVFNAGKIAEVEDRVKHTGVMVEKDS